ncbi:MAG: hypothetical protein ABIW81_01310 [Terrimesophilobacter sp.]
MSTPNTSTSLAKARRRLTLPSAKGMLITATMVAGAAVLGVSAAGGSFASWRVADNIAPSSVSSGSLNITVNDVSSYALDGTAWSQLIPGDVVSQQVSVKNTGTASATISASTTAPSDAIDVRVQAGACSGTITGPSSTTTPTTLAGTMLGGDTITVCVQVSLTPSAVQNQSAPFTVVFTATQVGP